MDEQHGADDSRQEAEKHFYEECKPGVFHSLDDHGFKGQHQ
jgi:hypothetical protein